jgi:excisionase family DNA binding protein
VPDIDNDPLYLLTVREVMDLLGMGKEAVYDLIASGELPSIAIGTRRNGRACRRRIRRAAVETLLTRWEQETAAQLAAQVA